jgi:hypothetical protein
MKVPKEQIYYSVSGGKDEGHMFCLGIFNLLKDAKEKFESIPVAILYRHKDENGKRVENKEIKSKGFGVVEIQ